MCPRPLNIANITDSIESEVRDMLLAEIPAAFSQKYVIGVSGGVDSVVLLHIMNRLSLYIEVVHINYKKRGSASDDDAAFVKALSQKMGYPHHEYTFPGMPVSGGNFQEVARLFRRQCFEEVMEATNSVAILLGHHRDDQTETVLQKLFRGAGTHAISGMDVYNPPYLRPLLDIPRSDIEAYAEIHEINWMEDESNQTLDYTRNWIRNEFSKALDEVFPGWDSHVLSHARRLRATTELADRWLDVHGISGPSFPVQVAEFISEDLGYLIVHHWLTGNKVYASAGQIAQVLDLVDSQVGAKIRLDDIHTVIRERDNLHLTSTSEFTGVGQPDYTIQTIEEIRSSEFTRELAYGGIEINIHCEHINQLSDSQISYEPDTLYLDVSKLKFPLRIRPWEEGDRIHPLGLSGTKLVSDLLTDQKIASSKKRSAYVISCFDENICAVIFPHPTARGLAGALNNACRITENTTSTFNIKIRYPI